MYGPTQKLGALSHHGILTFSAFTHHNWQVSMQEPGNLRFKSACELTRDIHTDIFSPLATS